MLNENVSDLQRKLGIENVSDLQQKLSIQQSVLEDDREKKQPFKKYTSASNKCCFYCGIRFGWLWNRGKVCSCCLRSVCHKDLSGSMCKLCADMSKFKRLEKLQNDASVVGVNDGVKSTPILKVYLCTYICICMYHTYV